MSESESDVSTRRDLLRVLARTARKRTQDAAPVLRETRLTLHPTDLGGTDHTRPQIPVEALAEERPTPARAPARSLAVTHLIEIAHSETLTDHDAELRALAQPSLRMMATDPDRAHAWILTSDRWAAPGGVETLVAQIDLAAAAQREPAVPSQGSLVLFVDPVAPGHNTALRTAHGIILDSPAMIEPSLAPMAFGAELVLPRLWHETVQRLEFDDTQAGAYLRVRARVRELQGVEDDDDGGLGIGYHRLLGYPNETTGTMPSECVRGTSEGSSESADWRLLLQISTTARRRLFVWIRDADWRLGRFEHLYAFVR
jgi:hypothetical protein